MQQAVETLVELSKDSLDMIAWALTELLDRLAKVRRAISIDGPGAHSVTVP